MGHYSIASQMFDSLELKNKFILLPMESHRQALKYTMENSLNLLHVTKHFVNCNLNWPMVQ